MNSDGKIDVVLTTWNEGRLVEEAIKSILDQTIAQRIESITIADDGSNDETLSILRRLPDIDERINVIYGPGGRGISRQRNTALAVGSAPFVALLDADDLWKPQKLELQMTVLQLNDDIGLAYSDYCIFSADKEIRTYRVNVPDISQSKNLAEAYFRESPVILPSCTLLRRSYALEIDYFDEHVEVFEDTDFFFRLARVCRFGYTASPLTLKRVHPSSLTESRSDLMSHHAFVSFRAIDLEPELARYLPRKLSERARKLGVRAFLAGRRRYATQFLALAVRLSPANLSALVQFLIVRFLPDLGMRYVSWRRISQVEVFRASEEDISA